MSGYACDPPSRPRMVARTQAGGKWRNRWRRDCSGLLLSLAPAYLARFGPALGGRTASLGADEVDSRPLTHHGRQLHRIPVRQPDASVRLSLAHLRWVGRAVDAVAFRRERDPNHADRIVRSGIDHERFVGLDPFESIGGIVSIGRIACDAGYPEAATRRRLFGAADRGRQHRDKLAGLVIGAQNAFGFVDFD